MSEVKRYWMDNQNDADFPYECTDGDWVKYEDYAQLKAEVERLRASSFVTAVPVEQYERLVKAGDACADAAYAHCMCQDCEELRDQWRDAKRGKQQ